eukprot:scpid83290/ scgid23265/ 
MGEPTKLLCSLPGIEQNVASLLQTLTTFVSESRDRERCLLRRLDELSAQIVELKEEVRVSLEKKSAITAVDSSSELPGSTHTLNSQRTRRTRTKAKGKSKQQQDLQDQETTGAHVEAVSRSGTFEKVIEDSGPSGTECSDADDFQQHGGCRSGYMPAKPVPNATPALDLEAIQDDSWQLVAQEPHRKKRVVVFIGNLSSQCNDQRLSEFITTRSTAVHQTVAVHDCSVRENKKGMMTGRVTVDADALPTVTSVNFWPRPLYAREWTFHEKRHGPVPGKGNGQSVLSKKSGKDSATHSSDLTPLPPDRKRRHGDSPDSGSPLLKKLDEDHQQQESAEQQQLNADSQQS